MYLSIFVYDYEYIYTILTIAQTILPYQIIAKAKEATTVGAVGVGVSTAEPEVVVVELVVEAVVEAVVKAVVEEALIYL